MELTNKTGAQEGSEHPLEAHRAIARELNRRAQSVYSRVGSLVVVGALAPPIMAVAVSGVGALTSPIPWMVAVTAALVTLLAGRGFVRRRIDALRARFDAYCTTNGLSREDVRRYYAEEGTYSFLAEVLDVPSEHET